MRISKFRDLPVIDCHVHFGSFGIAGSKMLEDVTAKQKLMTGVLKMGRLSKMYITCTDSGLALKAEHLRSFYAGGFVPWSGATHMLSNVNWSKYIDSLIETGFDGIGEMGAKPCPRARHNGLDGEYYRGFWECCELTGFPVLCHVADPEEFWDERSAPEWAKEKNWVYYQGGYPSKVELYTEMENVLDRHLDLKVVLCHFYFMSASLEKAADFLDKHQNANLDLALGIELMHNISRRRDAWRDFFIKYQDRIFFGTDIATWQTLAENISRIWLIRNFLESDEEFYTPSTADFLLTRYKEPFIGLRLPEGALRKIYAENFQRIWGKEPRKTKA